MQIARSVFLLQWGLCARGWPFCASSISCDTKVDNPTNSISGDPATHVSPQWQFHGYSSSIIWYVMGFRWESSLPLHTLHTHAHSPSLCPQGTPTALSTPKYGRSRDTTCISHRAGRGFDSAAFLHFSETKQ